MTDIFKVGKRVIDVCNLSKTFTDQVAVKDVSLHINQGEIFGFLGPNGSGKTTTIRMLCGLLTPDTGSGTCLGFNILTEANSIKRYIGYIPQFFGLYKQLTVYENLLFMAGVYGLEDRQQKINHVMAQLELTARRNQIAGTLSGGWKQRLSLAGAVLHEPTVLLLDEPTASVDPNYRREFWDLIRDFSTTGMTVLLSSQNMDEAELCDRIAYFSEGSLLLSGEARAIIAELKLVTWQVKGSQLRLLAKQLEKQPGIELVITFYDTLHVSGLDEQALQQAIAPYLTDYKWERIETTLEDVFVWLSRKSTNNTRHP